MYNFYHYRQLCSLDFVGKGICAIENNGKFKMLNLICYCEQKIQVCL
jgi:hypothetical protein